jgi:hypothetical protein
MERSTAAAGDGGRAMKWQMVCLVAALILLLVADALAFHDLFEPHTIRDWLMLSASALIVATVVGGSTTFRDAIERRR